MSLALLSLVVVGMYYQLPWHLKYPFDKCGMYKCTKMCTDDVDCRMTGLEYSCCYV